MGNAVRLSNGLCLSQGLNGPSRSKLLTHGSAHGRVSDRQVNEHPTQLVVDTGSEWTFIREDLVDVDSMPEAQ